MKQKLMAMAFAIIIPGTGFADGITRWYAVRLAAD